jgi:hypothetical protein
MKFNNKELYSKAVICHSLLVIAVFSVLTQKALCSLGDEPKEGTRYYMANEPYIVARVEDAEESGVSVPEYDAGNTFVVDINYDHTEGKRYFFFFEEKEQADNWIWSPSFVIVRRYYPSYGYDLFTLDDYPQKTRRAEVMFRGLVEHARLSYYDEEFLEDLFWLPIDLYEVVLWTDFAYEKMNETIDYISNTINSSYDNFVSVSREYLWSEIYAVMEPEATAVGISENQLRSLIGFDDLHTALSDQSLGAFKDIFNSKFDELSSTVNGASQLEIIKARTIERSIMAFFKASEYGASNTGAISAGIRGGGRELAQSKGSIILAIIMIINESTGITSAAGDFLNAISEIESLTSPIDSYYRNIYPEFYTNREILEDIMLDDDKIAEYASLLKPELTKAKNAFEYFRAGTEKINWTINIPGLWYTPKQDVIDGYAAMVQQTNEMIQYWDTVVSDIYDTPYSGGSGSSDDPFLISTAQNLIDIGNRPEDYDKHFLLTNDIDLIGYSFSSSVIPSDTTSFSGTFDGDGHVVSNLQIISGEIIGLFSKVASNGKISNLHLAQVRVNGYEPAGGLCGSNYGEIDNCTSSGTVSSFEMIGALNGVGGLVGDNLGKINNCYSSSQVNVKLLKYDFAVAGGLVGFNQSSGIVDHSYSSGNVSDSIGSTLAYNSDLGGICGSNYGKIENCYSTCVVSGSSKARTTGGIVGYNKNSIATVYKCFSAGRVTSSGTLHGAICGWNYGGYIGYSLWDTQTSGTSAAIGSSSLGTIYKVDGKTTNELNTESTYTSYNFDFNSDDGDVEWLMPISGYAQLGWQTQILIPNFIGQQQILAEATIDSIQYIDSKIRYLYNVNDPIGRVVNQLPSPGREVPAGSEITLIVANGQKYSGGEGTNIRPCIIANASDLLALGSSQEDYNLHFSLISDIDLSLSGNNLDGSFSHSVIVPDYFSNYIGFSGSFDGNGHTIRNLISDNYSYRPTTIKISGH